MPNKNFELGSTGKIHCKASGSKNIFWKKNQEAELPRNVVDVNGTLILSNVDISMKGKLFIKSIHNLYLTSIKFKEFTHVSRQMITTKFRIKLK